jgi:tetratricopeptide (TPR) repeat protein
MKKLFLISISVSFIFLFVGCTAKSIKDSNLIYSSQKKKPEWITKPPAADSRFLYFVGMKTAAGTLEEGKQSAIGSAVSDIVGYFGVKTETRYEEKKNEISSEIMDQIIAKGEAKVSGVKLEEMYYEQWKEKGGYHLYNIFILLKYPRAEIEREKKRIQAEKNRKKNQAQEMFNLAGKLTQKGEVGTALENYAQALKILKEVGDAQSLYRTILNEATNTLQKIKIEILPYDKKGETISGLKRPLSVKLMYQMKEYIPLNNIPVIFNFTQGKGMLEKRVFSDKSGIASSRVKQINFSNRVNTVEAFIEQDILSRAQAGKVSFTFTATGEDMPLWKKDYSLSFGRGRKKEKIIFYKKDKKQGAVLNIELFNPGAAEKIIFTLSPLEGDISSENKKNTKIEIQEMEFIDAQEEILFLANQCNKGEKKEINLSSLKIIAEIMEFKTKQYSNPYSGNFKAFEQLKLKISIF